MRDMGWERFEGARRHEDGSIEVREGLLDVHSLLDANTDLRTTGDDETTRKLAQAAHFLWEALCAEQVLRGDAIEQRNEARRERDAVAQHLRREQDEGRRKLEDMARQRNEALVIGARRYYAIEDQAETIERLIEERNGAREAATACGGRSLECRCSACVRWRTRGAHHDPEPVTVVADGELIEWPDGTRVTVVSGDAWEGGDGRRFRVIDPVPRPPEPWPEEPASLVDRALDLVDRAAFGVLRLLDRVTWPSKE